MTDSPGVSCPLHCRYPLRRLRGRYRCASKFDTGRDSQKDSCASHPNRRETSLFPEPTPLRCNVRSEDYTGQRDYAARLRCVSSLRQTGRTHSAIHLCLTPRRKATCGTRERTPLPLRVLVLALRIASRSQCCWLALTRLRQKRSSRPGTRNLLRGDVGMNDQPTRRFALQVFACEAGCRLCFPSTQTTNFVGSLRYFIPGHPTTPSLVSLFVGE